MPMNDPPLNPDIADLAPSDPTLTAYDEEHGATYMRLLDADQQGADGSCRASTQTPRPIARGWRSSHLSRARWMTEQGYRHLLRGGS
jgi:hypothetical protein